MLRKCLNKKYFFDKIKNPFKRNTDRVNIDDDNESDNAPFRQFTQYITERKEYKWRDYEAQIEVQCI